MDNREARFVLNAYRPGGQDAGDPRFAEALEQARRDPVLERWFSESLAFDAAMAERFARHRAAVRFAREYSRWRKGQPPTPLVQAIR